MSSEFVLLNEHVPCHYIEDRNGHGYTSHSTGFVCPLPKHYQIVVKDHIVWLEHEVEAMIKAVDKDSFAGVGSFVNMMLEYDDRSEAEQEKLRRIFGFSHILFSETRGLYGITAGNDVNSGDIYLGTDGSGINYYEFATLDGFRERFEKGHAWYCHNVDYYWQALKDREVAVRYYNILQQKLIELGISWRPQQELSSK